MMWEYGAALTLNDGRRVICLYSGDVPHKPNGDPVCGWYKLGEHSRRQGDGRMTFNSPESSFFTVPTAPPDHQDVRVLVLMSDYLKWAKPGVDWIHPVNMLAGGKVKTVEDWPLSCPKCGKAKSAYLGLNSYDCRWGCYARPSAKGAS